VELTPEQASVARACGFAFFPATKVQVQRLTMQKRIFRLDGQPFLATRDGTYWETHGTLMRLIEDQERSHLSSVVEAQEQVLRTQDARAAVGMPEITEVLRPEADPSKMDAPAATEIPTARRQRPAGRFSAQTPSEEAAAVGDADAPLSAVTTMDKSDDAEAAVEVEAAATKERDAPAARQRRARKPKPPRSVTVGTQEKVDSPGLEASPTKKNSGSTARRPDDGGPLGDSVDAPVIGMATDVPQPAEVPEGASGAGAESHLTRVVRRPPLGQPKMPRWATAGKERRGRLK